MTFLKRKLNYPQTFVKLAWIFIQRLITILQIDLKNKLENKNKNKILISGKNYYYITTLGMPGKGQLVLDSDLLHFGSKLILYFRS